MKYTKEVLEEAAANSVSIAGVLRYLGLKQAGGTQSLIGKRLKLLEVDTSHFTGMAHNRGSRDPKRKAWTEILLLGKEQDNRAKRVQLLRAMLEYGFEYKCSECCIEAQWNGKILVLEIDHINGQSWDNRPENLRFLCPNCHSQQVLTNRPRKYKVENGNRV